MTIQEALSAIQTDMGKARAAVDQIGGKNTKTYYVDGTNGNDTTGDGSQAKPYETVDRCRFVHGDETGVICYLKNTDDEIISLSSCNEWTFAAELATKDGSRVNVKQLMSDDSSNTSVYFVGLHFTQNVALDSSSLWQNSIYFRYCTFVGAAECYEGGNSYNEFESCSFMSNTVFSNECRYDIKNCQWENGATVSVEEDATALFTSCRNVDLTARFNAKVIVLGGTVLTSLNTPSSEHRTGGILMLLDGACIDSSGQPQGINLYGRDDMVYIGSFMYDNSGSSIDPTIIEEPCAKLIPPAPQAVGTYTLQCVVSSPFGGNTRHEEYTWV